MGLIKDLFSGVAGSEAGGVSGFRTAAGLIVLLLVGLFFVLFKTEYLEIWEVESNSMYPELEIGDRLLKIATSNYTKGDLLVFYTYEDPQTPIVKRLVGVEGDVVEVENGILFVNDKQLYPVVHYYREPMPRDRKWTLEADELFMAGDNQLKSDDSRFFGPISVEQVDGKIIYRISPGERRGRIIGQFPPPDPDENLSAL